MNEDTNIRIDEINWRILLRDLFYNFPLIIMAVLIVLMGVRSYKNLFYEPRYTTVSTLSVTAKGNASGSVFSSLTTANAMAEVYSSVFEGDVMREKIEEAIGVMPDDVKISSDLIPETNLLTLSVSAGNPKTAYQVIQAVLEHYAEVSDYLFGNAVLEVIKKPAVPVWPSNSFPTRHYDKLGIVAGTVLMSGVILFFSLLRNTVKMPKTARRCLEGECLGILPHEEKNRTLAAKIKRINKGLMLTNPVISFRFEESYNKLAGTIDYKMKQSSSQILMIASVLENEGKSTVAVNLATALVKRNKSVLLIDLDLLRPALQKFFEYKVPEGHSLNDYIHGKATVSDVLWHDKKTDIYAIMNGKGIKDSQNSLNSKKLEMLLKACKKNFDYIILDTSPLMAGVDAKYTLENADVSLLVVRQDVVRISDVNDAIEDLKDAETKFIGYVLNDFDELGTGSRIGYGAYGKYGYYGKAADRRHGKAGE